jgi:hypothetical protein
MHQSFQQPQAFVDAISQESRMSAMLAKPRYINDMKDYAPAVVGAAARSDFLPDSQTA